MVRFQEGRVSLLPYPVEPKLMMCTYSKSGEFLKATVVVSLFDQQDVKSPDLQTADVKEVRAKCNQ